MRKEPDILEITVLIDNSEKNIAYEYSDDNYFDAKRNEDFDRFLGEPEFELDSALASRYSFVALMKYIEDSSGYVVGEGVRNIEALSFDNNEVRLQIAMSGKDATKCYKIIDSKFEQVNECDF